MWECYDHLNIWIRWPPNCLANSRFLPAQAFSGWFWGVFLPNDVLGHTSVLSAPTLYHQQGYSSPPATESALLLSHSLCSPQTVFSHRACTNPVVLHHIVLAATGMCLHLSPSQRGERVSSCPCLQCATCSAPQPLPAQSCLLGLQPELLHLSIGCGEEMGWWNGELSCPRGVQEVQCGCLCIHIEASLERRWDGVSGELRCPGGAQEVQCGCLCIHIEASLEQSSVWKYSLTKGTGLCLWLLVLEMPCVRFITKIFP